METAKDVITSDVEEDEQAKPNYDGVMIGQRNATFDLHVSETPEAMTIGKKQSLGAAVAVISAPELEENEK